MPKSAVVSKAARRGGLRAVLRWLRAIRSERAGGATTVFALSLPAIVGFAGLGTEAASWYLTKRTMQGAADTAASAAGTALSAGTSSVSALTSEARSIAARSNFVNGSNGTTVTVNYPPSSGTYQGKADAVEVSISKPQPALLGAVPVARADDRRARGRARQSQLRGLRHRARQEQRNGDDDIGLQRSQLSGLLALREFSGFRGAQHERQRDDQCEQGVFCRQLQRRRPDDRHGDLSRRRSDYRSLSHLGFSRLLRLRYPTTTS